MTSSISKKEHIKLSWGLLEAKVRYYLFPHLDNIDDAEYDRQEQVYLKSCQKNGYKNSIQSMVGVNENRASVQLVIRKIRDGR